MQQSLNYQFLDIDETIVEKLSDIRVTQNFCAFKRLQEKKKYQNQIDFRSKKHIFSKMQEPFYFSSVFVTWKLILLYHIKDWSYKKCLLKLKEALRNKDKLIEFLLYQKYWKFYSVPQNVLPRNRKVY